MGNEIMVLLSDQKTLKKFENVLGEKTPIFISSLISAINTNPKLLECNPNSVINSALIAANLDLPINQNLGFAYIIPYKNQAQFQMGWKGFNQLALRTGQYENISVNEVYEGEIIINRFTDEITLKEKISDKVIGYLAYFKLKNGFKKYNYMTVEQLHAHGKQYSQSYNNIDGQWQKGFDGMARKTVLKLLLSKFGILSIQIETALTTDQAAITDNMEPVYLDNPSHSEPKKVDSVKPKIITAELKKSENKIDTKDQFYLLDIFATLKKEYGASKYYQFLKSCNVEHANEISIENREQIITMAMTLTDWSLYSDNAIYCEGCKKEIKNEKIIENSKKKFGGKIFCIKCGQTQK